METGGIKDQGGKGKKKTLVNMNRVQKLFLTMSSEDSFFALK